VEQNLVLSRGLVESPRLTQPKSASRLQSASYRIGWFIMCVPIHLCEFSGSFSKGLAVNESGLELPVRRNPNDSKLAEVACPLHQNTTISLLGGNGFHFNKIVPHSSMHSPPFDPGWNGRAEYRLPNSWQGVEINAICLE